MSFQITLSGHKDNQPLAPIEKLALDIVRLAKESDVGLTYVNVSHSGGSRAIFSSSTELDETLTQKEGDED